MAPKNMAQILGLANLNGLTNFNLFLARYIIVTRIAIQAVEVWLNYPRLCRWKRFTIFHFIEK